MGSMIDKPTLSLRLGHVVASQQPEAQRGRCVLWGSAWWQCALCDEARVSFALWTALCAIRSCGLRSVDCALWD